MWAKLKQNLSCLFTSEEEYASNYSLDFLKIGEKDGCLVSCSKPIWQTGKQFICDCFRSEKRKDENTVVAWASTSPRRTCSVWCIQAEVSLLCQSHSKWELSSGKSGTVCEQDRLLLQIWLCQVLCNTPLHQLGWKFLDCCTLNLNSDRIAIPESKGIYSYTNVARQQWDY